MADCGDAPDASLNWVAADEMDIAAARAGDENAYRNLILRNQAAIAQQMRRFSRYPQVCEELVHDVFVEAYPILL